MLHVLRGLSIVLMLIGSHPGLTNLGVFSVRVRNLVGSQKRMCYPHGVCPKGQISDRIKRKMK